MENAKKTQLYKCHTDLGGKIIEFAGWMLPVQYESIVAEHEAVRNNAGLFDVSHMGEVDVKGPEAKKFVQNLVTNDVNVLSDGQIVYSLMCYEDGGCVDDLLVYRVSEDYFYLVINAANIDKDFAWMQKNKGNFDVELTNVSEYISEVAFQGPKAQKVLQTLTDTNLEEITFFHFKKDMMVHGKKCLVSRTGYTGEDGFEVYCENKDIEDIWNAILEAGKNDGVKPAGLGCRDTLRFEATLPLYGDEIDKDISPLEACLGFAVKLNVEDDFIGKAALTKQKADGLKRKSIGFEMVGRGIPRHGYVVKADGKEIGYVTTGYASPTLKKNIGLALVDIDYTALDTKISVVIRNKEVEAKVISRKFLAKNYKK